MKLPKCKTIQIGKMGKVFKSEESSILFLVPAQTEPFTVYLLNIGTSIELIIDNEKK